MNSNVNDTNKYLNGTAKHLSRFRFSRCQDEIIENEICSI